MWVVLHDGGLHNCNGGRVAATAAEEERNIHRRGVSHLLPSGIFLYIPGNTLNGLKL